MCQLCNENNGDYLSCVDCSRLICFDASPSSIDVLDRAYVTESGDLYCQRCGRKYDEASYEDEEGSYYEPPYNPAEIDEDEGPRPEDSEQIGR